MHPHDERFLVVTAVENADPPPLGQLFETTPEVIMIEIFAAWSFKGGYLATLRIYSRHDVLDRPVLPRGIHGLEDEQQGPAVLRVKYILQVGQCLDPVM